MAFTHLIMNINTEPNLTAAFLHHQNELRQFLQRQTHCPDTADDLLHDTFLHITHYPAQAEVVNPRAFLYQVARNLTLDYQRKRQRWDGGDLDSAWECPLPQPEAVAAGHAALRRFNRLLSALPAHQRNLFVRCRVEGMTCRSLAEDERLSPRQVEHIVQQALKTLRPLVLES